MSREAWVFTMPILPLSRDTFTNTSLEMENGWTKWLYTALRRDVLDHIPNTFLLLTVYGTLKNSMCQDDVRTICQTTTNQVRFYSKARSTEAGRGVQITLFWTFFPCDSLQLFCCAYFEKTARFAEIFFLWQIPVMILNDFFEFTDAISCNLLLCFTRALSFWTFAMCRGCPVCFLIVDRPTLPIYIGISKTNTKEIAGQFARIHQWKHTGLPYH